MKESCGTLLFRHKGSDLSSVEVLLVHPSGPYNRNAPWSIAKGEMEPSEHDCEAVARRETSEETGVAPGQLISLGSISYRKSPKRVCCFAGPAPTDLSVRPASWEIDRCCFMPLEKARELLHPDQVPFLDRLLKHLRST
jgi:predicted NUDIX family NTP pyrophosphohydrolase